jgi:hypothetical protein
MEASLNTDSGTANTQLKQRKNFSANRLAVCNK